MKFPLLTGYAFHSQTRMIDFSAIPNFDLRQLFSITNVTARQDLYIVGDPELGFINFAGNVMTLAYDTRAMSDTDVLFVILDDEVRLATAAGQSTTNATLTSVLQAFAPLGLDASLQQILAAIQGQRAESVWTDDTGAFFVRIDKQGAITWTTPAGAAVAGPGAGARPAAGASVLLDKSSYQAIAAGTGFAINDLIDHVVTSDPASGATIGHFWLNTTQEATIAAPPAASVEPLSRLPDGASTAALQTAGNGVLSNILTALQGVLTVSGSAPVGSAPAVPPVPVSGVDGQGLKRHFLTDGAGATVVSAFGAVTDAAATSDAGAFSFLALFKRLLGYADTLSTNSPTLGQKAAAGSAPAVLASDQGGTAADAAVTDVTATGAAFTFMALLKGTVANLLAIRTSVASTLKAAVQSNAPRVTATGPLGASNATVTLALDGMTTAVLQLSGAWVGTASFLGSIDGGATYFPVNMIPYGGGAQAPSAGANGQWEMACGGMTHLQVAMSAYTSGAATALLAAASGTKSVRVGNPATNPLTVQGTIQTQGSTATTDQAVAVAAGADVAALATAASRQMLLITNTGASVGAYRFGGAASALAGHILAPGQTASFDERVPLGALHLFSTNGTSFFVTAG